MINKIGSPQKINVIKESAFSVDLNVLAAVLKEKWPTKELSLNDLHEALKSLGIVDYKAEDMEDLVGRLSAIGFKVA